MNKFLETTSFFCCKKLDILKFKFKIVTVNLKKDMLKFLQFSTLRSQYVENILILYTNYAWAAY